MAIYNQPYSGYGFTPTYLSNVQNQYPQQYPQQYQLAQQVSLNGRIIDDINTVTANEVSLSGEPSVFVKRDLSEIYVKKWNQNGFIDTFSFKPILANNQTDSNNSIDNKENTKIELSDDVTKALMNRFDLIDGRLDKLEENFTPKVSKVKKE